MPSEAVNRILQRVRGVQQRGNGWVAHCPAHDDKDPSLSITEGDDGRALVHCYAGCTTANIVEALGLTLADLMPDPAPSAGSGPRSNGAAEPPRTFSTPGAAIAHLEQGLGRHSRQWTYRNASGEPVGVVVRWDKGRGKEIRPVARTVDGWVIGGMPAPRPLYNLPDLADADMVYVTEGEKAADAAKSVGLVATTSAHGSGCASKTDWSLLTGKLCVILPDNDKAGKHYAHEVAALLLKLTPAPTVKIVNLPKLPEHGDMVDFVRLQGGGAEAIADEVRRLAEKTETYTESASDDWPEVRPLPDDLPPVEPYESDLLPASIRAFVDDVAERMQCPPDFTAVATLVVLGTMIGRRCGICPRRYDDWIVVPNLWGGAVGRPSLLKTPAMKAPLALLEKLEAEARKRYHDECSAHECLVQLQDLKKKQAEKDAKSALEAGKERDALKAIQKTGEAVPPAPVRQRFLTNDATVEKLGEILAENPEGILVHRDELTGWLYNLEKEGQQGSRAFYLEAWDGSGRFTYDRIGRGTIDIESATVSIVGGIQPGRLAPYVLGAVNGGTDDDGLLQRFQLLVWPDVTQSWRNVDRWPDTQAKQRLSDILARLRDFDAARAGCSTHCSGGVAIPYLRFEESAQRAFDEWRESLELRLRSGVEHPALESHLGKYRSLIPSLALILHLVEHERGPVGHSALTLALRWAKYLESHARRIYSAALASEVTAAKAIWRRIERGDLHDGFDARSIYRQCWTGLGDPEVVKAALELLEEHGFIVAEEWSEPLGKRGRKRSSPRYRVNPASRAKGAVKATDKADRTDSVGLVSDPEQPCAADSAAESNGR